MKNLSLSIVLITCAAALPLAAHEPTAGHHPMGLGVTDAAAPLVMLMSACAAFVVLHLIRRLVRDKAVRRIAGR